MRNKIKYIIAVGCLCALISCGPVETEISEGVIPKEQMIEVMSEVELTQALVKLNSFEEGVDEQQLYDDVFAQNNSSQEAFNKSLEYYCKDPKSLMNMYSKVIENLTKKQSEQQRK